MQLVIFDVVECFLWFAKIVLSRNICSRFVRKISLYLVTSCRIGFHRLVKLACHIDIANEDNGHGVTTTFAIPLNAFPQSPTIEEQEQDDETIEGQHEVPRHQRPTEHPHHHEAEHYEECCAEQKASQQLVASNEAVVNVVTALYIA